MRPLALTNHTAMTALDELIYSALCADENLMQQVGHRIVSTCFEVGPDEPDNTELPCIIVTDDGWQNQPETKDDEWEAYEDHVTAGIEVDGRSPKEVKQLLKACRKAVAQYVADMQSAGEEIPSLDSVQASQLAWDWLKPCYHQELSYQCTIDND